VEANASYTAPLTPEMVAEIDRCVEDRIAIALRDPQTTAVPAPAGPKKASPRRASIICFSGDMDKLLAAFTLANGAAALGMETTMYFAFWGLVALKKKRSFKGKSWMERLLTLMLPAGPRQVGCSKMNMLGLGPRFFRYRMRRQHVSDLPQLIDTAIEQGVKLIGCPMSMDVMGIKRDELMDGVDIGGVTTYLVDAVEADITLFI
jgi:peroxiredoxin family protein